jgi:hypothetical protein
VRFKVRYAVISLASLLTLAAAGLGGLHFKHLALVHDYLALLEAAMQEGDILCRLGDRTWSLYFKGLSSKDKRFSHMGIVHRSNNGITVINADGSFWAKKDYVTETPLREFINSARLVGLYRLNGVDGRALSAEALKTLGRPFDWDFDLRSADRLYCTELLYAVLQNAAPEIRLNTVRAFGKDIVPLDAISASPQFTQILYLGE